MNNCSICTVRLGRNRFKINQLDDYFIRDCSIEIDPNDSLKMLVNFCSIFCRTDKITVQLLYDHNPAQDLE